MLLKLSPNAWPSAVHSCCVSCSASHALSLICGLPKPIAVQNVLQLRAVCVSWHHVMPFTTLQPCGMFVHAPLEQTGFCIGQTMPQPLQLFASFLMSVHLPLHKMSFAPQ